MEKVNDELCNKIGLLDKKNIYGIFGIYRHGYTDRCKNIFTKHYDILDNQTIDDIKLTYGGGQIGIFSIYLESLIYFNKIIVNILINNDILCDNKLIYNGLSMSEQDQNYNANFKHHCDQFFKAEIHKPSPAKIIYTFCKKNNIILEFNGLEPYKTLHLNLLQELNIVYN